MRTPLGKVRGLGSAREGTGHFWRQRLTAIANIPLILFFVGFLIALNGAGFYAYPSWSPDGTKIAFSDNSRSLYVLDVASGAVKKISTQSLYSPGTYDEPNHTWSHDSKWLAYVRRTPTYMGQIHLYSVATGTSQPLTDGLSDAVARVDARQNPTSSSRRTPVRCRMVLQASQDMLETNIYRPCWQRRPLAAGAESDEEKAAPAAAEKSEATDDKKPLQRKEKSPKKPSPHRLRRPRAKYPGAAVEAGGYSSLQAGKGRDLFPQERDRVNVSTRSRHAASLPA